MCTWGLDGLTRKSSTVFDMLRSELLGGCYVS